MTRAGFVTATLFSALCLLSVLVAPTRVGAENPAAPLADHAATVSKDADGNEARADPAKSAQAGDAKRLRLFLTYQGESDKPFYDLILIVPPAPQPAKPFKLFHQISEEQGAKILSWLKESQFFEHAAMTKAKPVPDVKPHYLLRVELGDENFEDSLGWDLGTVTRLNALRESLDGDAAKSMDQLLARLDGMRKVWESNQAAIEDHFRSLHDRYKALILDAASAGDKQEVEARTDKFNASIGGKLLFVQVTPRVGPIAEHKVLFSKFFDPSRKLGIGKIHFAVTDKPIVSQNHDGQGFVLVATNPLGDNKWPDDLQLTLVIDQAPSPETAAYENAIDQVVKKLPKDGMWTNGLTPHIDLGSDAKPEDVVAEAVKKYAVAGDGKPHRLLYVRAVKFDPPIGTVSAALIQNDAGTKVLIFYPFQRVKGWWTRFYDSDFVPPKAAVPAAVQKGAVYQVAIDKLVARLAVDGLWQNGRVPMLKLAADAKPADVIAAAMTRGSPVVDVQPYRVLHLQEILSEPQFKSASAAVIQNESETSALIFFPVGSWTRFYAIDIPADPTRLSTYSDEMFNQAVERLNSNRRSWNLNGRVNTVKLPADATAEEVIQASLQIKNAPFNEIKSYRVVSVRKLEKLIAPGKNPWSGALLDTNRGQRVLLWGYLNGEAAWLPVLLDLVPSAAPTETKSPEAK